MTAFHEIVTHPFFGVFSALAGFFFGHRFTLWRDRRKEFNAVAETIYLALLREKKGLAGPTPSISGPAIEDFYVFRRHLSVWQRRRFDAALVEYQRSKGPKNQVRDVVDEAFYEDDLRVSYAINRLMRFTTRK